MGFIHFVGLGFGGGGENKVGVNAAELPQQMQPVPPMHGGASADATEPQPSPAGRLLGVVGRKQVLQLQATGVEM